MRGTTAAGETGAPVSARRSAEEMLALARKGDGEAFGGLVELYRLELQVHCYRILGSVQDAEDLLQEALLAAWRGLGGYQERASVRTWLYRIATNRCLDALRAGSRRPRAYAPHQQEPPLPEPWHRRPEPSWLEPCPDVRADHTPGPEARYEMRESVSLAFLRGCPVILGGSARGVRCGASQGGGAPAYWMYSGVPTTRRGAVAVVARPPGIAGQPLAALQQLPSRQRAVLVLRDVLGFRAAEVANILETTPNAVTGALKRARSALSSELPGPGRESPPLPNSPEEHRIVDEFIRAFESGDVDAIVATLTNDAWLTMPPLPLEYQGTEAIRNFLSTVALRGGSRYVLIPTRANGQLAFGTYLRDPRTPFLQAHGVIVLTLAGDRVATMTRFLDNALLAVFGLPRSLNIEDRTAF